MPRNRGRRAANTALAMKGLASHGKRTSGPSKKIDFPNDWDFEILIAAGSLKGHTRILEVVTCYLPPEYTKPIGDSALDHITEVFVFLKREYRVPYIVVAGDYNQQSINKTLLDFPFIQEAPVGPTRQDKAIDRIFTNLSRSIEVAGTLAPLESEDSSKK